MEFSQANNDLIKPFIGASIDEFGDELDAAIDKLDNSLEERIEQLDVSFKSSLEIFRKDLQNNIYLLGDVSKEFNNDFYEKLDQRIDEVGENVKREFETAQDSFFLKWTFNNTLIVFFLYILILLAILYSYLLFNNQSWISIRSNNRLKKLLAFFSITGLLILLTFNSFNYLYIESKFDHYKNEYLFHVNKFDFKNAYKFAKYCKSYKPNSELAKFYEEKATALYFTFNTPFTINSSRITGRIDKEINLAIATNPDTAKDSDLITAKGVNLWKFAANKKDKLKAALFCYEAILKQDEFALRRFAEEVIRNYIFDPLPEFYIEFFLGKEHPLTLKIESFFGSIDAHCFKMAKVVNSDTAKSREDLYMFKHNNQIRQLYSKLWDNYYYMLPKFSDWTRIDELKKRSLESLDFYEEHTNMTIDEANSIPEYALYNELFRNDILIDPILDYLKQILLGDISKVPNFQNYMKDFQNHNSFEMKFSSKLYPPEDEEAHCLAANFRDKEWLNDDFGFRVKNKLTHAKKKYIDHYLNSKYHSQRLKDYFLSIAQHNFETSHEKQVACQLAFLNLLRNEPELYNVTPEKCRIDPKWIEQSSNQNRKIFQEIIKLQDDRNYAVYQFILNCSLMAFQDYENKFNVIIAKPFIDQIYKKTNNKKLFKEAVQKIIDENRSDHLGFSIYLL
jgi:hypothetical protein